jgi:hypothetical protein
MVTEFSTFPPDNAEERPCKRHFRPGCLHRLANTSTRSDVDCHVRLWLGAALGGLIEEIRPRLSYEKSRRELIDHVAPGGAPD